MHESFDIAEGDSDVEKLSNKFQNSCPPLRVAAAPGTAKSTPAGVASDSRFSPASGLPGSSDFEQRLHEGSLGASGISDDVMSGLVYEAMWSVDALAGSRTGAPLSSSGCLSASLGSNWARAERDRGGVSSADPYA